MSFVAKVAVVIGMALMCAAPAAAWQWPTSGSTEYITSSSPLPDGSMVTTTYYPKSGASPETKWSSATIDSNSMSAGSAWTDLQQNVLRSATGAVPTSSSRPSFEMAQLPSPPATAPTAAPVQMPTWGNPFAGPRAYVRPNFVNAGTIYPYPQTAAAKLPTGTIYPYPVASTPPSLNTIPVFPAPSAIGSPPVNQYPTRVGSPPMIRFQNLPPGTYFGRGIIGQPRAYVDGQPVRNLMRYVFP